MSAAAVTVWYDGACLLCRRKIGLVRRLDQAGRIAFEDVSGPDASCPLDRAALLARSHAREGDGPVLVGAAAFAAVWRAVPLLRPLGLAARRPRVLALLDRAYAAFLQVRPRLQACLRRWEART